MKMIKSVPFSGLTASGTRMPLGQTSLCRAPWEYALLKKAGSVTRGPSQGAPRRALWDGRPLG